MKNPDNGWVKRRLASVNRGNRTVDGRPYSEIRFDRCVCRNSKPRDERLCDRCRELQKRGFLMRA
jgi:hypothetical protein